MRKTLHFIAFTVLCYSIAIAQDDGVQKNLTSNYSRFMLVDHSTACETTTTSLENHYYKIFDLASLGVEDTFNAQSFQFGVQSLESDPEAEPIVLTVNLWRTTLNNFPENWGNEEEEYELAGTATVHATSADTGTLLTVYFESPVTFTEDEIVIAEISHNQLEEGTKFFIGSNSAGDDQPSYIMGPECENMNLMPTLLADIGSRDMYIIMSLMGIEGGPLGVEDFENANLTLYPNPATDQFQIISEKEVIQTVSVRDILGKTIKNIQVNALDHKVNVSNLPKGLYLVEVELETGRAVQKLVKI